MTKKTVTTILCVCVLSVLFLLSCGLEDFSYIDYIPQGSYSDTQARIRLPSSSADGYSSFFTNFIIFYRIYISDTSISSRIETTDQRNQINTALNSDFSSLYSLTDITSTTVNTANLENTFFNRQYFLLNLQGANIDSVLDSGSLGKDLVISFPTNALPTLMLSGGTSYNLQRARSRPQTATFQITPNDGYFMNHPYLYDTNNATNAINADVAGNSKPDPRYTYVSLYIAAKGRSRDGLPQAIFSQPTFVGIFKLADSL